MLLGLVRQGLFLPLAAVVVLTVGGCGGGGNSGSGGGDVRDQLQQMVLGVEDLPPGYSAAEGAFSSNEEVALGDEEKLAKLQAQGRILGYQVSFDRGEVSEKEAPFFGVESDASLFETEEGAKTSFAGAVEEARATDWETQLAFGDTETQEVQRSIAEETVWIRVTGVVALGESQTSVLVIDDYILMRQGRARGFVRVSSALEGSSDRDALREEIAALAEAQVKRTKGALD